MTQTSRSIEALLSRRALAEKATPGPWKKGIALRQGYGVDAIWDCSGALVADTEKSVSPCEESDAAHIAVNSPAIVMADIDEILRLRAQVERLEKEADWLISTKIVEEWNGRFVGAQNKDNSGYAVYPTKAEAVASWREAARKAIGCK